MKPNFKNIGLLLFLCFIFSCKEDKPLLPSIITNSVVDVLATTAISGGTLTEEGSSPLLKMGLCWSTSPEPTIADRYTSESLADLSFSSNLTQLTPNTKYYVRAYAINSNGTSYGNQITFTTSQFTFITAEISSLSSNSAISGGYIKTDNSEQVSAIGVCWGTSQNPTIDCSKTIDGNENGYFVSSIKELMPGTLYYLRAYATFNDGSTVYGNQLTFQTLDEKLLTKTGCILCGGSIISTYDGGHIIFGYIYKQEWFPYLIKLDSAGNRIWETEVSLDITCYFLYSDILETKEHKIVFCYKSFVVMLDENGEVLWKFDYKKDEQFACSSLIESDENNLFVLSTNGLSTMLLKVSLDGKLLSDKLLKGGDDVNYNCGYLLSKIDYGKYILAGYSNVNLHNRIWVAEFNSMGDIQWENSYIDAYVLSKSSSMIKTKDGGVIITGYSMVDGNATYARVLKLDSDHKLTWEKSYSWDYFSNHIYSIIQDSNGDYVFCGSQGYQQVEAVIVKLNKDGNELWKRTYWPIDEVDFVWSLSHLLQNSKGGYILVGTQNTLWGEAKPKGIWIKNVDANGY
jgi:hypothetical protein